MGGEIRLARLGERIDEGVVPHAPAGCRRRPGPNSRSRRRGPRRRRARGGRRARPSRRCEAAGHSQDRRLAAAGAEPLFRLGAQAEDQGGRRRGRPAARTSRARSPRTGGPAGHRRTRWRRAAVGPVGHVLEPVVPGDRRGRRRRGRPAAAARRAGLVSTRCTCAAAVKSGQDTGRAQHVGHQRAAPRSELDEAEGAGRPIACQISTIQSADQLAEHLADLGRGGEIAGRAERDRGSRSSACRHSSM